MAIYQKAAIYSYGKQAVDEEGEPLWGFYWQLLDNSENPITDEWGPYRTFAECYSALDRAYQTGNF